MSDYSVVTNKFVTVQISSEGSEKFIPVRKNFSKDELILDIKRKLEPVTSADANTMTVKLYDMNDKFICTLDSNERLLGSYPVDDGMRLHVEDEFRLRKLLEGDTNVEKFELSEEDYKKRTAETRDVRATSLSTDSSSADGIALACPGKTGRLLQYESMHIPKLRRPNKGEIIEKRREEEKEKEEVEEDGKSNLEESSNDKSEPSGSKFQQNLYKRKTCQTAILNKPIGPPSPVLPTPSKKYREPSTSQLETIVAKSNLRATAEEFKFVSKRIPIIDPKTNKEIVIDDVASNGDFRDANNTAADSTVASLLYNSGFCVDYENIEYSSTPSDPVFSDIAETMDYLVKQLVVNPGSFDDLMQMLDKCIVKWDVSESTLDFLLSTVIDVSIGLNNFSYFGVKICCHLDKTVSAMKQLETPFRNLVLTACEDKFSDLKNLLSADSSQDKAYSFIFFLAELYDQLKDKNDFRIRELSKALGSTFTFLLEDPNSSNIRCLCKALKLTGRLIYQDNRMLLQGIIDQLKGISMTNIFDSQTSAMLSSVIGLANCNWGFDDDSTALSTPNGDNYSADALRRDKGAEMYGPDGNVLSYEEKKFLGDNCLEPAAEELDDDLQDSYHDSDDGMDEEMQEAFEQFLLSVPEAR